MGRSGSSTNQAQSAQDAAISKDQVARANKATDAFNADLGKMKGNPNLYANPYKDPEYLRNQNLITSAASSAVNNSAANQLNTEALRTGSNTASREASIRDLARQKSRAMVDYQAGRNAQDRGNYLDWERFLLGANLAPANVNTDMFRTATGGQNSANTNLANIQNAQSAMWGNIIGGLAGAGASAYGASQCWIAEQLYGVDDLRTHLVRAWLSLDYAHTRMGRVVVGLYRKFGRRIAAFISTRPWAKALLKPLFDRAHRRATAWWRRKA